jgi:hypothetical protein
MAGGKMAGLYRNCRKKIPKAMMASVSKIA